MNNKGLTMIELIVTIGLITLIGIVISTNMLGILSNEEDNEYDRFVKEIEESACMYIETAYDSMNTYANARLACMKSQTYNSINKLVSGCNVSINELIESGYLDEDLIDPSTGSVIDSTKKVIISWDDERVKHCYYGG